ncbi:unnamed protein product [Caretta caretta]
MLGRLLHLQVRMEGLVVNLINVYAPTSGLERLQFYQRASAFLGTLDFHEFLVLGGDFNTTLEEQDRSGTEQSPAAVDILREMVEHRSLVDIWRDHHPDDTSTFTFVRMEAHWSSHFRLDRIYLSHFHLSRAHSSSIQLAPFSDHHLATMTASLCAERPGLAYWHFNNSLLEDEGFVTSFWEFWLAWRGQRRAFPSAQGWRAVLALLPKKGDLRDLRNWRPVSLLSTDYKIVAKAISLRLGTVLVDVIRPDQTYTVPDRSIFDNLFLVRDLLELGRREECLVKLNWTLTEPVSFGRGVRQGCPLLGQLYALAIEPFLGLLRRRLTGLVLREPELRLVLSAYADDVLLMVQDSGDLARVEACQAIYSAASSARVNWVKSSGLAPLPVEAGRRCCLEPAHGVAAAERRQHLAAPPLTAPLSGQAQPAGTVV